MSWAALGAALLVLAAVSELRYVRKRRADRVRVIDQLARTVGIGPAVKVALELGWIGEDDVRSDGDNVSIRLRRWRPLR